MDNSEPRGGDKARRFDPLAAAAAGFFALALVFAALPAIRAGSATVGGMLLLIGLAGVAIFTVLALRSNSEAVVEGVEPDALLQALAEPACLVTADGRITDANAGVGRQAFGGLPPPAQVGRPGRRLRRPHHRASRRGGLGAPAHRRRGAAGWRSVF